MEPQEQRIDEIEMEVRMAGDPQYNEELHQALIKAGFVVKGDDSISPDWEIELGAKGLDELSYPQLAELVQVAHRDLAGRIALDVKSGMSVEEAYMARAATDPAATLIAEATIARNDKAYGLQAELQQLKESAVLQKAAEGHAEGLVKTFSQQMDLIHKTPNELRGLEMLRNGLNKAIRNNPQVAEAIRKEAENKLHKNELDWKDPDRQTEELVRKALEDSKKTEKTQENLQGMSSAQFTQLAAREYVDRFVQAKERGADDANASTVAVAHIKELAKKAKLRIALRDVKDSELLKASKDVQSVEKILTGKVRPPRTAALSKSRERENEKGGR